MRRVLRPGGTVALVDATWFPEGVRDGVRSAYGDDVLDALPVARATTIDDTARLLEQAGLVDIRVEPLTEIHALDSERGVAPDHEVRLQHLLTARASGVPAA